MFIFRIRKYRRGDRMEKLITVRELFKETDRFIDKTVQVGGWVRNNRGSKAFGCLVINDGSF